MTRKSVLQSKIEAHKCMGYTVAETGSGKISLNARAKLAKAIARQMATHTDAASIIYVQGGRAWKEWSNGYHWAVMYR